MILTCRNITRPRKFASSYNIFSQNGANVRTVKYNILQKIESFVNVQKIGFLGFYPWINILDEIPLSQLGVMGVERLRHRIYLWSFFTFSRSKYHLLDTSRWFKFCPSYTTEVALERLHFKFMKLSVIFYNKQGHLVILIRCSQKAPSIGFYNIVISSA